MKLKRFVQITLDGGGSYLQPIEKILDAIEAEFDGHEYCEVGTKWTLEIVEMTQEDYDKLPEFEGH